MLQKNLVESTNADEIRELIFKMQAIGGGGGMRQEGQGFFKSFSGWELPIPIQHAALALPNGPFQDFIYILVAKSKQLLMAEVSHKSI